MRVTHLWRPLEVDGEISNDERMYIGDCCHRFIFAVFVECPKRGIYQLDEARI